MAKIYNDFEKCFSKFKIRKTVKGKVVRKTPEEIAQYFYNQGQASKQIELDYALANKQYEIEDLKNNHKEYAFTYDCDHCGHEIENWTLDITGEKGIKIPTWQLAQTSFDCPNCGACFGTGDIDVIEFNGPDRDYDKDNGEEMDEENEEEEY